MKKTALLVCLFAGLISFGQDKYVTKTGQLAFEASVPSFEEVKASNNNVSAILNTATGEFVSLALMQGFRFKVALMEEHFNENYIESSKYPKATFKGKIENFSLEGISAKPKEHRISGTLKIHGETKKIEAPVMLSFEKGTLKLQTGFSTKPEDFNIE
ncbi:MAG: YceI family protein, partial [Marinirhabdus sp.]